MLKFAAKSHKLLLNALGVFALIVGISSASAATIIFIHQPKCPQHLLK